MPNFPMRGHVFYGVTSLSQTGLLGRLDRMGVPRPDLEALAGRSLWLADDRFRIRRALEACMFGSLDMLGLQRFAFSAEWIAVWIALMVDPANHLIACSWWHGAQSADSILSEPSTVPMADGLDAGQIFALVQEAHSCIHQEHGPFAAQLEEAIQSGQADVVRTDAGRPKRA